MRIINRIRAVMWALLLLALLAGCRTAGLQQPGVEYAHLEEATPWSIYVVAFDLARPDLALLATVGAGVNGSETVGEMVALLPRAAGVPIAAINGDYFEYLTEPRYRGTLQGMTLLEGELAGGPAGTTFWLDDQRRPHLGSVRSQFTLTWPDGATTPFGLNCSTSDYKSEVRAPNVVLFTPAFGPSTCTEGGRELVLEPVEQAAWLPLRPNAVLRARVREVRTAGNTPIPAGAMVVSIARKADATAPAVQPDDLLTIDTALAPNLAGARTAISGDPLLLVNGELVPGLDNTNRHPRTAVGFAGSRCVLAVVDGRKPGVSVGMSHRELAELMKRLGCTDALNLDGGGSSTFWYDGQTVNAPSDGKPRPVGNGLVLVRTATGGK